MGHGQPLGEELSWAPADPPTATPLVGERVLLRAVDPSGDAPALYSLSHPPRGDLSIWTYLPDGPYDSVDHMRTMLEWAKQSEDPLYFTIVRRSDDRPLGLCSYLRITPEFGVIEIGHIWFGAPLQRTSAATEAIYLLARRVFDDLGYRRLEWKCNSLNEPSRRAALRFGFTFEGIFRKHQVVKGRNRDTAWYAITDEQWPTIRDGFERWLDRDNFDAEGRQRRTLREIRLIAEPAAPTAGR